MKMQMGTPRARWPCAGGDRKERLPTGVMPAKTVVLSGSLINSGCHQHWEKSGKNRCFVSHGRALLVCPGLYQQKRTTVLPRCHPQAQSVVVIALFCSMFPFSALLSGLAETVTSGCCSSRLFVLVYLDRIKHFSYSFSIFHVKVPVLAVIFNTNETSTLGTHEGDSPVC
jgi:hypothetical protein